MAIEQHLEELRAELSWCEDRAERDLIEAEIARAQDALAVMIETS